MSQASIAVSAHPSPPDLDSPMTVKEAAKFLGVSSQTVYLWVERKQIPHLRVMGRNIRFLKQDLEAFRSTFNQEVENGTTEEPRRRGYQSRRMQPPVAPPPGQDGWRPHAPTP